MVAAKEMTDFDFIERYIPNWNKYFNRHIYENGEYGYGIRDEILTRRLSELRYPRSLQELSPRERNSLEDDVWSILKKSFSY